jgi:hypothetical protein
MGTPAVRGGIPAGGELTCGSRQRPAAPCCAALYPPPPRDCITPAPSDVMPRTAASSLLRSCSSWASAQTQQSGDPLQAAIALAADASKRRQHYIAWVAP